MSGAEARLREMLDRLAIPNVTHEHEAVFTVEQSAGVKDALPGGHTKNLFLIDKAGGHWLVCAIAETRIDLKALARALGAGRFSFGSAANMEALLGVTPGSVTLFALINDAEARVRLVLDAALFDHEIVNFHPLRNTATTAIPSAKLWKFVAATERSALLARFDVAGAIMSVEPWPDPAHMPDT